MAYQSCLKYPFPISLTTTTTSHIRILRRHCFIFALHHFHDVLRQVKLRLISNSIPEINEISCGTDYHKY